MATSLSRLFIHPVKSLRGLEVAEARLTRRGLAHDRRFMVVGEDGVFVTQRELGAMATLSTAIEGDRLVLSAADAGSVALPLEPAEGETRRVRVFGDTVDALDAGEHAAAFLRAALGTALRLVYMPETTLRPVDPDYAPTGEAVSFADGFPLLMISEASLADLNVRLDTELPMERFRPNLVLRGSEPYAEDGMAELEVGAARLFGVKLCSRCVIPSRDHETGEPAGPNPLGALARYRRRKGKVYFGQNVLVGSEGVTLRVGDAVRVLQHRAPEPFDAPREDRP